MLIEYTVKFQKDGLTITQRIENGTASPAVKPGVPVQANALKSSFQKSKAAKASGPSPQDETTGPSPQDETTGPSPQDETTGPVNSGLGSMTVFGPFINWPGPLGATNTTSEVKYDQ
jgi:hypothetical protein